MMDAAQPMSPKSGLANRETPLSVLVLQGGGALGSYQAGVYCALCEHDFEPQWIAGISIGAINAALIAGNKPADRIPRLKEFWRLASSRVEGAPFLSDDSSRMAFNMMSAATVATFGVPGFFAPRWPAALLAPRTSPDAVSYYDTLALRETLLRLVDFEEINRAAVRFSVGAVNVRTGNFAYFDNTTTTIRPEHIMASGALPPGLPPVEIDGEFYWDGGLVSNTPLQYVLDSETQRDMSVFQVDLFSARGPVPANLIEAAEREKDIRYSSRTRLTTDVYKRLQNLQSAITKFTEGLPAEWRDQASVRELAAAAKTNHTAIFHLIYRRKNYESHAKDYDFSRVAMLDHWTAGETDVHTTFARAASAMRDPSDEAVATYDLVDIA